MKLSATDQLAAPKQMLHIWLKPKSKVKAKVTINSKVKTLAVGTGGPKESILCPKQENAGSKVKITQSAISQEGRRRDVHVSVVCTLFFSIMK